MILKTLTPLNYGPFAFPEPIEFEPDVTVLTGANDTGKTSILRLIQRICSRAPEKVTEDEFNADTVHDNQTAWQSRPDFGAVATFVRHGESFDPYVTHGPYQHSDRITVKCSIAPNRHSTMIQEGTRGDTTTKEELAVSAMPRVIYLPPTHEIQDVINLSAPNPLEQHLIMLGFGPGFTAAHVTGASPKMHVRHLEQAARRLTSAARRIIPPSLNLEFGLRPQPGDSGKVCIFLEDGHGGITAFGQRGTGIRRIMSLVISLLGSDLDKGTSYILIDEPETSLHADAQHFFRRLLEYLGDNPNLQVIYATHSPSMINVLRPHSIRLFRRDNREGKPTSRVTNRPFEASYLPVRASLGLTPADSLLYAPVTIIVEGDTEVIGIPLLFKKLSDNKVPEFEKSIEMLNQVHFLDGMGDKFHFICKLAKSQGAKPIIFLDGDKARHLQRLGLDKDDADVPVVTMEEGKEFEQLVPHDVYLRAVAEYLGADGSQVTAEAFKSWDQAAGLPPKMMFSKRVARWLESLDLPDVNKAAVMRLAIANANVTTIDPKPLQALMGHIKRLLA